MSEALAISEMFSGITEPIEQWRLSQWETVMERCNLLKGYALRQIRDKELYLESHFTFKDYLRERWDYSESYGYRLMNGSEAVEKNLPIGKFFSTAPANESQVRELLRVEPEQQRQVWQTAVETAPEGKITAAHIRSVVERLNPVEQETIKTISREITARNAEAQRETYRAEAREVGLTPQQEAAADFGAGWYKNMHRHWVFYNSLRDHGGIAKLARKWSKEIKRHTLTEMRTVRDCMNECIEYFEKELGK